MASFREIWFVDFEFRGGDRGDDDGDGVRRGERPSPLCMVARERASGRTIRMWRGDLASSRVPPFDIGDGSLVVAYFANAEMGCFRALGWERPVNLLDLYSEHRAETNEIRLTASLIELLKDKGIKQRQSMLGALAVRGLDVMGVVEKEAGRRLVLCQDSWSEAEQKEILDYCQKDVIAAGLLFDAMRPKIDWPRALLRGRYSAAVAAMEWHGVPIDTDMHGRLVRSWAPLKERLIADVDTDYGVYVGNRFNNKRFLSYLDGRGIAWPRLLSGAPCTGGRDFQRDGCTAPCVGPVTATSQDAREVAAYRAVGGLGRFQPLSTVAVRLPDWEEPTEQHEVYLRVRRLDAKPDKAAFWTYLLNPPGALIRRAEWREWLGVH